MQTTIIKDKKNRKRNRIILFASILIVLSIIAGGFIYWQSNKKHIIEDKLEAAIRKKSNGLHKISYDNLNLNEKADSLSITNMHIEYNNAKYENLKLQKKSPSILFKIHIPQLLISGIKNIKEWSEGITAGKLEIKNPSIDLIYTQSENDSAQNISKSDVYEKIIEGLDEISVDTLIISGGDLRTNDLATKKQKVTLSNIFVQMFNVKVDSVSNTDSTRFFFSEKVDFKCATISWTSANKLYKYGANQVSFNTATNDALISKFYINPQLSEDAFVKNLKFQDDRFHFAFQNITINDLDVNELLNESFIADNINIGKATFKVYRDLTRPRDDVNRVGMYPHQIFSRIAVPVAVKKITVNNAFVEYKERNHITRQSGKVQFYNTTAVITNVVNKKELIANNNVIRADISSDFLNKTPMKTTWLFYLGNSSGRFDVRGKVESIDGQALNPLAEPMGPSSIEKGKVEALNFDLSGNNYSMNGTVKLLYSDLKVALLEKDGNKMDKKNFTSLIANLVIKNSNTEGENPPLIVQVDNKRNTNRSIFNLSWKTLFKGIKETLGIKK